MVGFAVCAIWALRVDPTRVLVSSKMGCYPLEKLPKTHKRFQIFNQHSSQKKLWNHHLEFVILIFYWTRSEKMRQNNWTNLRSNQQFCPAGVLQKNLVLRPKLCNQFILDYQCSWSKRHWSWDLSCYDGLQIWSSEASTSVSGQWLPILAIPYIDSHLARRTFPSCTVLAWENPSSNLCEVSFCPPPLNNYNGFGLFLQIKQICILAFRIADPRAFVNLAPSTNTWKQGGRSQKPHVCTRARWCDQDGGDSTFVPWPFCRGQDQKYLRSSAPPDVRLAIVTFQAAGDGDVQWLLCQGLDLLWSRRDEEQKWLWIETCTLGVGSDAICWYFTCTCHVNMKGRGKAADVSSFERDPLLLSFCFWEKIGLERVISEWTFLIMSTKT